MEKRHDERLNEFHMDDQNLGFYFVSYSGDLWEELENVKLYEVKNPIIDRTTKIQVSLLCMTTKHEFWERIPTKASD